MNRSLLAAAIVSALALAAPAVSATPIAPGSSISFSGDVTPTGPGSDWITATGVGFSVGIATVDEVVSASTGTFAGLTGSSVAFVPSFMFDPFAPVLSLWSVGGFSFDLLTVTVISRVSFLDQTSINLGGTGIIRSGGDASEGSFFFSAQGGGSPLTFSFSATDIAGAAIPLPGTLALLGFGIAGLGVMRRRSI
jgi:hypothetical protein